MAFASPLHFNDCLLAPCLAEFLSSRPVLVVFRFHAKWQTSLSYVSLAKVTVKAIVDRPRRDSNAVCEGQNEDDRWRHFPLRAPIAGPSLSRLGRLLREGGGPQRQSQPCARHCLSMTIRSISATFLHDHAFPRLLTRAEPYIATRWIGRPVRRSRASVASLLDVLSRSWWRSPSPNPITRTVFTLEMRHQ